MSLVLEQDMFFEEMTNVFPSKPETLSEGEGAISNVIELLEDTRQEIWGKVCTLSVLSPRKEDGFHPADSQ